MFKRIPLPALLGMMLVGCHLGQAYRCGVDVPCDWHSPTSGLETSPLCGFVWWEELHDSQLNALMNQAYLYNPDVRLAASQNCRRSRGPQGCSSPQEDNFCETWNTVATEVAKSYIQLRGLQLRLELVQRSMDSRQESIKLIVDLVNRGIVSEFDWTEVKGHLNTFSAEKPSIELEISKAIHHLSVLVGYAPGELACQLLEREALPELPCYKPIGSPEELLWRRSDVRQAARGLAAGTNQAVYTYQKTVLTALEEVENALASYHFEWERYHYLDEAYQSHQKALALTQDLASRGLKNEMDLLEMRTALFQAEDAMLQSRTALLVNYVSLYKALGASDCL